MMSSTASRHGRQLQRYSKSGRRLVVGCIPYKVDLGDDDESSVQVLVISSSKGNGFMFPKGGWETDETIKQAVSREAMEEAGVRGIIEEGRIGTWVYKSRTHEADYQAIIFPMKVTEELVQWPEMHQRQRAWVSIAEAKERCHHWWMKEALDSMVKMISISTSIRNDSTGASRKELTTTLSFH